MFGIFSDCLPDGWGRLLVDRMLRKRHIDPASLTCLDRLAIVGNSGMGALSFKPEITLSDDLNDLTLDRLAEECAKVLSDKQSSSLDDLFRLGGSSGGARPKIITTEDDEEWIIKFPSLYDPKDIGKQEYDYAICALRCGIDIPKVRLFPSECCQGYFGSRRFDRSDHTKVHMASVSALLEISHRIPNLDYDSLMRMTLQLTGSLLECERVYRLMCFNVFAHNRDDHSKNFSFLYVENEKRWTLSPAYDLTYSSSLGGEHATTVHGNGIDPSMQDILNVAQGIGINKQKAKKIATEIQDIVNHDLKDYLLNKTAI